MSHETEYHDAMVTLLELVWGRGYMAPGGAGNVDRMVAGLDLRGQRVLDLGCGIGGPALHLAARHGARVVGIDIEEPLVARATRAAREQGLADAVRFETVEPGPLVFPDASFDLVFSSGAITQIADKAGIFRECCRVLKPGGHLSCYDWMKSEGEYSPDMLYFFEMEGLTYAMETLERHGEILAAAGFVDIELEDASDWYRRESRREYEAMRGALYPRIVELLGEKDARHFVEDWRSMVVVCERGEMRQCYCRGRKPQ